MRDWDADERRVAEILRTITPDLDGLGVYIVPAERLASITDPRSAGMTAPSFDLIVRPFVHWVGRGYAAVYSQGAIENVPEPDHALTAVAAHELAHYLTMPPALDYLDAVAESLTAPEIGVAALRWFSTDATSTESRARAIVAGHGAQFFRALCHLRFRLALCEMEPSWPALVGYGDVPFPVVAMHAALLRTGELEHFAGRPIREALSFLAPAEFRATWFEFEASILRESA